MFGNRTESWKYIDMDILHIKVMVEDFLQPYFSHSRLWELLMHYFCNLLEYSRLTSLISLSLSALRLLDFL